MPGRAIENPKTRFSVSCKRNVRHVNSGSAKPARITAVNLSSEKPTGPTTRTEPIGQTQPASDGTVAKVNERPLRILYLHQYFQTPQCNGGTRSYEFAKRMIAAGHQVTVITSTAGLPEPHRHATEHQKLELDGIPVLSIAVPYDNTMNYRQRIRAFLRFAIAASVAAVRQPADVIFATSTPLTIAIPAILARLWQRKPMVFEVRDLWPELPIAVGAIKNPILKSMAHALEWAAYHASKHVVALSPGMADGVMRRGLKAEQVTVIPNSCDIDLFDVPPERGIAFREKHGLGKDQPLVVYSGTFGLINGAGYLVDVAVAMRSILPEARFFLVGDGAERPRILRKAAKAGVLDQNLRVLDPMPKTEIVAVQSAATVATSLFLPIPAMENNSANKFFDALAAGRPIAINHGGWQADLLRESGAGIVLPYHDPEEAARLLAAFLTDTARLEAARAAARQLAQTQFARDHLYAKLDRVLLTAVGRRSRGSQQKAEDLKAPPR
jgi:glycosyltransferase involved in cell wall biosynthesis